MTAQAATYTSEKATVPWWLVLIQGIAAILIGIFLLISPATTTFVVVQFLGFYWLISGIFGIISIFIDHSLWGWKLLSGVLGIIAGVLIIQHPLWSTLLAPATLVIVLGVAGLIIGVINLIQAFRVGGWGIGILGVLSIIFGLILLANTMLATIGLPFVLGIFGLVFGVIAIFGAFRVRREAKIGLQQTGIEFVAERRFAGQSKYSFSRMLQLAMAGILSFSTKPLQTGIFIGVGFAALAFMYMIIVVIDFFINRSIPSGWTTLVVLLLFFSGVQLIVLGIIGAYIGSIFEEVKGRPRYIIEEVITHHG